MLRQTYLIRWLLSCGSMLSLRQHSFIHAAEWQPNPVFAIQHKFTVQSGATSQKSVNCTDTAINTCTHNQTSVSITFPPTTRPTRKPLLTILSAKYLFAFIIFVMHTARAAHLILNDPMILTVYWHHFCNALPDQFIIMHFTKCYKTNHKARLLFHISSVQIQYCFAQSLQT